MRNGVFGHGQLLKQGGGQILRIGLIEQGTIKLSLRLKDF